MYIYICDLENRAYIMYVLGRTPQGFLQVLKETGVKVDSMLHLANLAGDLDGLPIDGPKRKNHDKPAKIWWLPGYPLVNIQKAMENGHRNSGFSH